MTNRLAITINIVFCVIALLLCSSYSQLIYAYSADEPLVIGIFPRRNAIKTIQLFKPLESYLSEKLKRKVILQTSKNFATFWHGVKNKRYDLVHFNQYHYLVSHKQFGYDVILKNVEFGEATITGSIIVRKDSGINTVKDLKGKSIVFGGGPKAMQSYIFARYLLETNGLTKGDYKVAFAKNPPNAILATAFKQADAAGSGEKVLRLGVVQKQVDTSELKYLIQGEQLAHLPWAVDSDMPDSLKLKIQSLLVNLNNTSEGKKVLKSAKLDGLEKAGDLEYNPHRKIVEYVLKEKY